ncbi:unnamed protein product [Nesidiocoris tenuis]|uniref:Uncharacterized protein n=1 Tax=Nesidiocoris tenuis TaxID=355587 RepID=A0A6H5HMX2_9HEMI|nr:unnamed protein product [Nesidiocoris tenuis]
MTRHPYDEWRPVREAPPFGRHVLQGGPPRYPVFHNSKAYSYPSSKRILNQPLAENSDTVEVFSPAPPSILGSLSVFGHATVNAREPASHITKKSPRPPYTPDYPHYERPKLNSYNVRNEFGQPGPYQPNDYSKKPNRYMDYNDPYFPDSTLRPPPRDSLKKVSSYSPLAQSTSLSPNSFFYDQPQPFQPSAPDHSFEKVRKPINSYHFSTTAGYSTPSPLDYRTTVNDYDHSTNSFYKPLNNKGSLIPTSWNRNPFGDISLSTRHPEIHVKPVVEEKEPTKDLYNQYSHLGRPFQNPDYTTTVNSQREVETYSPFVTTFPSPPGQHNVKFSDVAHPFHVRNDFRNHGYPSNKPEYTATQDTYNQDVYPVTVTTVDAPTEPARDLMKKHKDTNKGGMYLPEVVSRPFSKNKNNYDLYPEKRPQVQITSYQGYNENPSAPFLPTPTPDVHPYAPQPTIEEETTDQPEVSSNAQDYNYISTMDNQYRGNEEGVTEYPAMTTTAVVETTTTPHPKTKPTLKSRRRPTRPSQTSKHPEGSKYKNHRIPDDEYSTTVDYYKYQQRRRKPSNKYRDNSEFKRYRTTTTSTTTTTLRPQFDESTELFIEDTTIVSEAPKVQDVIIETKQQDGGMSDFDKYYSSFNADRIAPVENIFSSQSPVRDVFSLNYADIFSDPTTPSTTTSSTTTPSTTTSTTTTTTTTVAPVSVTTPTQESTSSSIPTRLKNKYGNNRPRFSVKDYRDRLNRASSTTASPNDSNKDEETTTPRPKNDIPKILSRMRPSPHQRSTTEAPPHPEEEETTPEPKYRKYKPRLGPSRNFYKTSTTAAPESLDTTTTERINTFRPSTNRYKPGTGKYYSRYRTSSLSPKEVDDSPATTTAKITIKPKGVFSAKRRPSPMKNRPDLNKDDDGNESSEESPSTPNFGDTLKINDNEVIPGVLTKKIDDGKTTIAGGDDKPLDTISEDQSLPSNEPQQNDPPTGSEAMRVADLTSSSSNDFHSPNIFKTNIISNRRIIPKITLPSDEPILPLEAFFQTRHND